MASARQHTPVSVGLVRLQTYRPGEAPEDAGETLYAAASWTHERTVERQSIGAPGGLRGFSVPVRQDEETVEIEWVGAPIRVEAAALIGDATVHGVRNPRIAYLARYPFGEGLVGEPAARAATEALIPRADAEPGVYELRFRGQHAATMRRLTPRPDPVAVLDVLVDTVTLGSFIAATAGANAGGSVWFMVMGPSDASYEVEHERMRPGLTRLLCMTDGDLGNSVRYLVVDACVPVGPTIEASSAEVGKRTQSYDVLGPVRSGQVAFSPPSRFAPVAVGSAFTGGPATDGDAGDFVATGITIPSAGPELLIMRNSRAASLVWWMRRADLHGLTASTAGTARSSTTSLVTLQQNLDTAPPGHVIAYGFGLTSGGELLVTSDRRPSGSNPERAFDPLAVWAVPDLKTELWGSRNVELSGSTDANKFLATGMDLPDIGEEFFLINFGAGLSFQGGERDAEWHWVYRPHFDALAAAAVGDAVSAANSLQFASRGDPTQTHYLGKTAAGALLAGSSDEARDFRPFSVRVFDGRSPVSFAVGSEPVDLPTAHLWVDSSLFLPPAASCEWLMVHFGAPATAGTRFGQWDFVSRAELAAIAADTSGAPSDPNASVNFLSIVRNYYYTLGRTAENEILLAHNIVRTGGGGSAPDAVPFTVRGIYRDAPGRRLTALPELV